jgi:tRNA 2-selenouridine synthase
MDIGEFLRLSQQMPVIDVRSPAEFEYGHFPGAINLPLFSNEERSLIGTLYMKKGSNEAIIHGLEIIGPKMATYARLGYEIAPERKALMYCWRGGMRSNSLAWLLNTVGIETHVLLGGYKTFRRYAQDFFNNPVNLVVIGGMTGTGKTKILEILASKEKQIIHLEKLAGHRGSVFGGIGQSPQPSTEQFENDLYAQIAYLKSHEPVFIEDESLSIGNIFIPGAYYNQMSAAPFIEICMPMERRIQLLVEEYGSAEPETLIAAVQKIERRLGLQNASEIVRLIEQGLIEQAVERILIYYDKKYTRSMSQHVRKEYNKITVSGESFEDIADAIYDWAMNRIKSNTPKTDGRI